MSKIPRRNLKRRFSLSKKRYRKGRREDKKRRNPKPYGGYLK